VKKLIICAVTAILAAISPARAISLFENNQAGWNSMVTTLVVTTINWDDLSLANGTSQTIPGNQYSGLTGSPTLSVDAGSGLYVIDPGPSFFQEDFITVSGENVFAPDDYPASPQGILTISFGTPVYALGAWFLDVEGDYAGTGIKVGGTLYAFSANQGDNSQSFLGIVSITPFTTVEIYMANGPVSDGVGIDDIVYAVPEPATLFLLGLGGLSLRLRSLRQAQGKQDRF